MADRHYQVLARKWRPQRFSEMVGQQAIVRTLSNALDQGRIAHAYCLSGIRGVGKTTLARLFAKGLNCRRAEAPTSEPCCECAACIEIEESRNLDVVELDAASQTGVDDIRVLNEVARYTPSRDRYRVFIIDEAHMLSSQAFNALLKTLEEPPPRVVFLLATTEPHKILPTVLSRCQHYPLGRISQREIGGRLREIAHAEGVRISDDALALVSMAADGSLRDAQSLLDKVIAFGGDEVDDEDVADLLGMVDRELLSRATELIADQDLDGVLALVNQMMEQGVDLHQFTLDLIGHFRNLLIVRTVDDAGPILHLPEADLGQLGRQAERFEVEDLDRAFALLSSAEYRIKQSEVPRYQLEVVLSRLARMPRLRPLEELIADLEGGPSGDTPVTPARGSSPTSSPRGGTSSGEPARGRAASVSPPGNRTPAARAPDPGTPPGGGSPVESGSDGERVLGELRRSNPIIARALTRAEDIEVREGSLLISFGSDGGIFRARLRQSTALEAIEAAAREALGRELRVMTSFDDSEAVEEPPEAPEPSPRSRADEARREELWKRVEHEPMVEQFVDALQGHLTDVEEA